MPLGRYIPGGICCMFQHPEKYLHDVVSVPLMIFAHRPVSKMADFSSRVVSPWSSGGQRPVLPRTKVVESDAMPLALMQADGNPVCIWVCGLYTKSCAVRYGYV